MELKVTSGGGMLAAIPTGFFSSKFRLEDNAALVGEIEASMWRERAQLELKDGTYSLYRTNVTSGDFVAERQGQVVARATKTSLWRDDFDVEIGKRQLKLRKPSIWNRAYAVLDAGKQVGTISSTTIFTRRAVIDLPTDWSLLDRSFLFWLCFIMWRRQSEAAS
jgi:hypothetical protein